MVTEDAVATKTSARVARLLILVELRKVFRNCIRAESLLQQESPVYKPADPREQSRVCLLGRASAGMQQLQQRLAAGLATVNLAMAALLVPLALA